jgi:PAS domain S-box-containing protein
MTCSPLTLLLIEDCRPDRELYRCYLMSDSECTYRFLEAETISEGLELCRTQAIDAILLGYVLPDGNGLEFIQALHTQNNRASPPIVMVTDKGDERLAVQAIKQGAEDYLAKHHLTPELLQVTVRSAINNARVRLQLQQAEPEHLRYETDLKPHQQQLQESEQQLQLGIKVAGVALARFDYVSNTVTLSPEAAVLYGIEITDLTVTRDRIHANVHPDDRNELARLIEQALHPDGAGWFAHEYRVYWRNGEVRWLSVRKQVFFDRSGETPRPDHAILAAIDVTQAKQDQAERQQVEETLRQSEERYRYLSSLIPQLVWIATADGVMLDVNQRWTDFTGLTLEQAQTDGWQQIVHPDDVPILAQAWQQAQQEGSYYQAEGRIQRADGIYHWHLHQATPLKNAQGQIVKWFGTATDIHDRKQIEADRTRLLMEAQAAREEAEAANRSKDDFVAVVAHELRSPLNSIAGWARLLQTRQLDEATIAKALDTIWRNTQAQVQLVEDLLDISRMVRGTLQLQIAPVNLIEVIEAALDVVRPLIESKPIQLELRLAAVPQIEGDFNRLQQIAVNLMTNAIKFTPAGGRVEVSLSSIESEVMLRVQDTGKGIAPEILPEIFEHFKQGQQNMGAKDGLGLGLAIVKNLVELHHGTVTVESPGIEQGTTVTVRLPR